MNLPYNPKGVGDVAFVQIEPSVGPFEYGRKHGVVEIEKEDEVVGYNMFNVSNSVTINGSGRIKLTTRLIKGSQQLITEAGFDHQLDTDVPPKFIIGYVETKEKYPDTDKLSVLNIDAGAEKLQIVCEALNAEPGQEAVVVEVEAVMSNGIVAKDAQLCGVDFSGMICSMKELNLPNAPREKGIVISNDDYDIGQAFFE